MAQRSSQIIGYLGLLGLVAMTAWAFYGLSSMSQSYIVTAVFTDAYIQHILIFSLQQAALSASAAVLCALPVARALYYLPNLWGKRAFLALCLLSFVLPSLILITSLVILLGSAGWFTPYLPDSWSLYGLQGILLAHLFLNIPFAIRAFYFQLQALPPSAWQLARQLKLSSWQHWSILEWPQLRGRMLVVWGFVFVLCFNSFAVVLALGGGPQATTLEVAIYQALKYDFNIPEALSLAWLQLLIAGSLFALLTGFGGSSWLSTETKQRSNLPVHTNLAQMGHTLIYIVTWIIFSLPFWTLLPSLWQLEPQQLNIGLWAQSTLITLGLAGIIALGAVGLALCVLFPIRQARLQQKTQLAWLLECVANHSLIIPAMVLSVGLYIWLLKHTDPETWGMLFVVLINMLILVPFGLQQLKPRLFQFDDQYARLTQQLKLNSWQYWKVLLPWIKPDLQSAFILVLLLAIGDVAIFSIFGSEKWATLPWLIYSYAGSYRLVEAAVLALLLLLLCGLLVLLFEKIKVN